MKSSLTFVFLFIYNFVFSQVDYRINYYPAVYKAEALIAKEDYKAAQIAYKVAFANVKVPLNKELYNATICCFLNNDFEAAKPYLIALAKKGIPIKELNDDEAFNMKGIAISWQKFNPVYEQYWQIGRDALDPIIVEKIIKYHSEIKVCYDSIKIQQKNTTVTFGEKGNKIYYKNIEFEKLQSLDSASRSTLQTFTAIEARNIDSLAYRNEAILEFKAKKIVLDFINENGFLGQEYNTIESKEFGSFIHNLFLDLNYFNITPNQNAITNIEKYNVEDLKNHTVFNGNITSKELKLLINKLEEAVKNGKVKNQSAHRFEGKINPDSGIQNTIFKITIENKEECSAEIKSKGYLLFLKNVNISPENLLEYQKVKERYGLDSLTNIQAKDVYSNIKNQYFDLDSNAIYEETTVSTCETALKLMREATIIN
jgi:hypothetical protein